MLLIRARKIISDKDFHKTTKDIKIRKSNRDSYFVVSFERISVL